MGRPARLTLAAFLSAASISSVASISVAVAAPAPEQPRPAALVGSWKGGPAKEGGADYCVQEARFSSGHLLMVGRTKSGEVNLALGIPGGALPVGERWKVAVSIDGAAERERVATAAGKGLLVIGMGFDPEFFDRLKKGKALKLKASADDIGLQLTSAAKALADLEKCAAGLPDLAVGGKAASGLPGGTGAPPFPETLAAILGAAGLREVQTLAFPDVPPEKRPADYAWRVGRVLGGVRERNVAAGVNFDELTANYAQALKDRCKGPGSVALAPVERLPGVSLRSAAVDCAGENGKGGVHVALVSYLSDANLFAVFFHEAPPANKTEADDIRDRLAEVFRNVARIDQPSAAGRPPSVAPPSAAPPASTPPVVSSAPAPHPLSAPAPQPAPTVSAPVVPVPAPSVAAAPPVPTVKPDPAKASGVAAKPSVVEQKSPEPKALEQKPPEPKAVEQKPEPKAVEQKSPEQKSPEQRPDAVAPPSAVQPADPAAPPAPVSALDFAAAVLAAPSPALDAPIAFPPTIQPPLAQLSTAQPLGQPPEEPPQPAAQAQTTPPQAPPQAPVGAVVDGAVADGVPTPQRKPAPPAVASPAVANPAPTKPVAAKTAAPPKTAPQKTTAQKTTAQKTAAQKTGAKPPATHSTAPHSAAAHPPTKTAPPPTVKQPAGP